MINGVGTLNFFKRIPITGLIKMAARRQFHTIAQEYSLTVKYIYNILLDKTYL